MMAVIYTQVLDLQRQVQVISIFQKESKVQAKRPEADYLTL